MRTFQLRVYQWATSTWADYGTPYFSPEVAKADGVYLMQTMGRRYSYFSIIEGPLVSSVS